MRLSFYIFLLSFAMLNVISYSDKTLIGPAIKIKKTRSLNIITIGIDYYNESYQFLNAENDARSLNRKLTRDFYNDYPLARRFQHLKKDSTWSVFDKKYNREQKFFVDVSEQIYFADGKKIPIPQVRNYNFLGKNATKESIYQALNRLSEQAKPEDYFIFYFGSISHQDELGDTQLYFHGDYGKNLFKLNEKDKELIGPLAEMAIILNKIKAKRQLFIFEAGNGQQLTQNLLFNLFDDNPIFEGTERNRCIITTRGNGMDQSQCDPNHGPLTSYLLKTKNSLDFFKSRASFYSQVYSARGRCKEDNQDYIAIYREDDYRLFSSLTKRKFQQSNRGGALVEQKKLKVKDSLQSQTYALVVGTNKYHKDIGNLKNPINDANSVANLLEKKYNCKVSKLLNPTIDTFKDSLLNLSYRKRDKDKFIFFVAGHGFYNPQLKSGHLVFTESRPNKEDKHLRTYYQMATLKEEIDALKANNVFAIFDVCFGSSFELIGENLALNDYKNTSSDVSLDELIEQQLKPKSRIFLASGKKQVPDIYWKNPKHSPFADKLIKILEKEQSFISAGKIFNGMVGNVTQPVIRDFRSHEPQGDFLLKVNQ